MGLITIILFIAVILGVENTINKDKSIYSKIRKRFDEKSKNFKEFESRGG